MVTLQSLTKSFDGKVVVDNLSFNIAEGETLVILGTSGSGKTTTLKMINRLTEPDSGNIFINNVDVVSQPPEKLRRAIGYVIQHTGLFPHYNVSQNVSVVPKLLGWDDDKIQSRVNYLLEMVGLDPTVYSRRMPDELSGGQKQRVGIARALAADPPLILLDEPFGALDPITRSQLQEEFKHLESMLKKTMVLVTHDVAEAIYLGDRICLMEEGKIQQIGTPKQLVFSPENDFVKGFFGGNLLQSQMLAIQVSELVPFIDKKIPEDVQQKNVYQLLQHQEIMATTGLAEKTIIDAFYQTKQNLIA